MLLATSRSLLGRARLRVARRRGGGVLRYRGERGRERKLTVSSGTWIDYTKKVFPTGVTFGFGKGFSVFPWLTFPQRHPIIFGSIVAGIKTGLSDWIVQRYVEDTEHVNWRRVGMFTAFGLIYMGGIQYFVYVPLFSRILFPGSARFVAKPFREKLKDRAGQIVVMKQVALDLIVHEPFVYFPIFYLIKEYVYSTEKSWVSKALKRWRNNFISDVRANWMIWAPAFAFNFAFCPMHLRVPFVALVSFGWTMILSAMRGAEGFATGESCHLGIDEDGKLEHSKNASSSLAVEASKPTRVNDDDDKSIAIMGPLPGPLSRGRIASGA